MACDLLIKNGLLIDGTGAPARRADVAIAGGCIAEVGSVTGGAKRMVMRSQGIEYTIVNGAVTWEKGELTGTAAGTVLRS